jgi:hypothetical protein
MAHFAKIEDGVVTQVIVVDNKDCADATGVEKESIGIAFCERLLGGTWKQTSYNGTFRKTTQDWVTPTTPTLTLLYPLNPLRLGYLMKKPHNGMPQYQCLKMRVQVSHPSNTHGMKILLTG